MDTERRYSLPESVCNDVLAYLGTQPYNATAGLIQAMREHALEVPTETPTAAAEIPANGQGVDAARERLAAELADAPPPPSS